MNCSSQPPIAVTNGIGLDVPLKPNMSLKMDYKTDNGKDDVTNSSDNEDSEMSTNEESYEDSSANKTETKSHCHRG